MDAFASVLTQINVIANLLTAYNTLQAFIIIGLITKLLLRWSFQARLSLLTTTIFRSVQPVCDLVIVILVIVPMVAIMANVLLGERLQDVSNIAGALQDSFSALLGSSSVQQFDLTSLSGMQQLGAVILVLTEVILVMHVLLFFFVCIFLRVGQLNM